MGRTSGDRTDRRHDCPSAAAGSIPFLPRDTLAVLQAIHNRFPAAWTRYGFVDSFNPLTGWYATDVVGIAAGIFVLMAENYQTSSFGKRS